MIKFPNIEINKSKQQNYSSDWKNNDNEYNI